jgi:dihydrolipoamide dehydrogenase
MVVDAHQALHLESLPQNPLIIGAGATGLEFASFWAALGSNVTIIESGSQVLPGEEPRITSRLSASLQRAGIVVQTNAAVSSMAVRRNRVDVELADGTAIEPDLVLLAVGRSPTADETGLAALGLTRRDGRVDINERYQSAINSVRAIGSCATLGGQMGASVEEATMVVDDLAGLNPGLVDYGSIPRMVRTSPEVAFVGLTAARTRSVFGGVITTSCESDPHPRVAQHPPSRLISVVTRSGGDITGVHVLGHDADMLAGLASVVVRAHCTPKTALETPVMKLRIAKPLRDALERSIAENRTAD